MSFLYRSQPIIRQAFITAKPSPRLFSTAVVYHKTVTDTAKDTLKGVDRTVSDTLVKGIDKGVELKDQAATAAGVNIQKPAEETAGQAKGKAAELAGEAKGKAHELAGQAKGKAEEVKSKM